MSRPYHGQRRSRPNRRLRYPGGGKPPRRSSYQSFGLRHVYNLFFPDIRGPDRRRMFNDVSTALALLYGVFGAGLGWGLLGPFGVVLGFGAGLVLGAEFLTRKGFYRP